MLFAMSDAESPSASPGDQSHQFPATHWTLVLTAGQHQLPQAQQALETLCCRYRAPLYSFARQRGCSVEDAEDLTQEFFLRLLQKDVLSGIKREGGRFRSFLLTAFKCFLINEWHRAHAKKRGGGATVFALDAPESEFQAVATEEATPETIYEQRWIATLLARVINQLREDYVLAGNGHLFDILRDFLPGADNGADYASASVRANISEATARMSVHRLRRRYREVLRNEIAATVSTPAEINDELRYLLSRVTPGALS